MSDFFHPRQKRDGNLEWSEGGITLRDHIAIQAMTALIVKYPAGSDEISASAYRYADAMLKARDG